MFKATDMNNLLILIAVGFFLAAIIVGTFTDNTWKNTAITWTLLFIGSITFGIVLTI